MQVTKETALHIAAGLGHANTVATLMDEFASVNVNCLCAGSSPLYVASKRGHVDVVNVLLQHPGLSVNQLNRNDETAIFTASAAGHLTVVESLLSHPDVDPDIPDTSGQSPFYIACAAGSTVVVDLFASYGGQKVRMNLLARGGFSPLYAASVGNHPATVAVLVAQPSVDVNIANMRGMSPLHAAAARNYPEVASELLKSSSIRANQRDNQKRTPLYAAVYRDNVDVVKVLAGDPRVDVNRTYEIVSGQTLFQLACLTCSAALVTVLADVERLDVHAKDRDGLTALQHARAVPSRGAVVAALLHHPRWQGEEWSTVRGLSTLEPGQEVRTPSISESEIRSRSLKKLDATTRFVMKRALSKVGSLLSGSPPKRVSQTGSRSKSPTARPNSAGRVRPIGGRGTSPGSRIPGRDRESTGRHSSSSRRPSEVSPSARPSAPPGPESISMTDPLSQSSGRPCADNHGETRNVRVAVQPSGVGRDAVHDGDDAFVDSPPASAADKASTATRGHTQSSRGDTLGSPLARVPPLSNFSSLPIGLDEAGAFADAVMRAREASPALSRSASARRVPGVFHSGPAVVTERIRPSSARPSRSKRVSGGASVQSPKSPNFNPGPTHAKVGSGAWGGPAPRAGVRTAPHATPSQRGSGDASPTMGGVGAGVGSPRPALGRPSSARAAMRATAATKQRSDSALFAKADGVNPRDAELRRTPTPGQSASPIKRMKAPTKQPIKKYSY